MLSLLVRTKLLGELNEVPECPQADGLVGGVVEAGDVPALFLHCGNDLGHYRPQAFGLVAEQDPVQATVET